jgi:hypothetical protein
VALYRRQPVGSGSQFGVVKRARRDPAQFHLVRCALDLGVKHKSLTIANVDGARYVAPCFRHEYGEINHLWRYNNTIHGGQTYIAAHICMVALASAIFTFTCHFLSPVCP